jgi:hypothetical protein
MKIISFYASCLVLIVALSPFVSAQRPSAAPQNLLPGIGPLLIPGGSSNWTGLSAIENIPGTSLYAVQSDTTVLYIGFTAGTTVKIGNMVLYTTAREDATITEWHSRLARRPSDFRVSSSVSVKCTAK